jgi:hypothetical protein
MSPQYFGLSRRNFLQKNKVLSLFAAFLALCANLLRNHILPNWMVMAKELANLRVNEFLGSD